MRPRFWAVMLIMVMLVIMQIATYEGSFMDFVTDLDVVPELLGIIITVFIVDELLSRHSKKEKEKVVKDIIGNQYEIFITKLSVRFINYITKKPFSYKASESQISQLKIRISDIKNNISVYVMTDFVRVPVKALLLNPQNIFGNEEKDIPYQVFCEVHFKRYINSLINEFLNRYISVLPMDIKIAVFKISDLLESGILSTPLQHGIEMDISNAIIKEEEFRLKLKDLSTEIEKLLELCE